MKSHPFGGFFYELRVSFDSCHIAIYFPIIKNLFVFCSTATMKNCKLH